MKVTTIKEMLHMKNPVKRHYRWVIAAVALLQLLI